MISDLVKLYTVVHTCVPKVLDNSFYATDHVLFKASQQSSEAGQSDTREITKNNEALGG